MSGWCGVHQAGALQRFGDPGVLVYWCTVVSWSPSSRPACPSLAVTLVCWCAGVPHGSGEMVKWCTDQHECLKWCDGALANLIPSERVGL